MPTEAYYMNDPFGESRVELDNGTWIATPGVRVCNDLSSDVVLHSDYSSYCCKSDEDVIAEMFEMWTTKQKEKEKKAKVEKKLLGTVKIKYNDQVTKNPLSIDHVIFSGPATIVFWADGDKTIVKCKPGDEYSYDVGIAMATLKKIFGDSYSVYKNDVKRKIKAYG